MVISHYSFYAHIPEFVSRLKSKIFNFFSRSIFVSKIRKSDLLTLFGGNLKIKQNKLTNYI